MTKAVLERQLIITVDNRVGTLAEITSLVASSKINLIAMCAYAVDNKGVIMFVCDNSNEAKKLLKSKRYDVREEEVILLSVSNKPGALQAISQQIADVGIDLTLVYGSVDQNAKTSRMVLVTEDNESVLMALNFPGK